MITIDEIHALSESDVQAMKPEVLDIKGHKVYLVELDKPFGYSALVFRNGYHIFYANDYELHHSRTQWSPGMEMEELRNWYITKMNNILFTEEEIAGPLRDYNEFTRKEYFLRNYYSMAAERLSIFGNFSDANNVRAYEKKKKEYPYYSDVAFAFYKDEVFVQRLSTLYTALLSLRENRTGDYDYWKDAFKREMANHEYHINWEADHDTLSAFGNVTWHDGDGALSEYFDELNFNEIQRRAYIDARKEYLKEVSASGY